MIVGLATDELLAERAAAGDDPAFCELARRYRALTHHVGRWDGGGVTVEDLRQEALIGLFEACRKHDPAQGAFGAMATVCVRNRLIRARRDATRLKHRVLSDAFALDCPAGDDPRTLAERVPAPEGADPARVFELRERLRELAAGHERRRQPEPLANGRFYTDAQITRARGLVKDGKSLAMAAAAVGAARMTVWRWVKQAA